MIDCHTHTFYSKHAVGTVDELVLEALAKGIQVLTVTDHAPFYVDGRNRLLDSELDRYFEDIERAKRDYAGRIKILRGLEFDYAPCSLDYTARILNRYDLDFAIGSIHYIPLPGGEQVKVWDLPRLSETQVIESYFRILGDVLQCGLFDAIGHADILLRGVPDSDLVGYFETVRPLFVQHGVAFELNASGLRKTTLDLQSGREVHGTWSYPSLSLLPELIALGTTFTIGSDTHTPVDVGSGISEIIGALMPFGLDSISYFEQRKPVEVPAKQLASTNRKQSSANTTQRV